KYGIAIKKLTGHPQPLRALTRSYKYDGVLRGRLNRACATENNSIAFFLRNRCDQIFLKLRQIFRDNRDTIFVMIAAHTRRIADVSDRVARSGGPHLIQVGSKQ